MQRHPESALSKTDSKIACVFRKANISLTAYAKALQQITETQPSN